LAAEIFENGKKLGGFFGRAFYEHTDRNGFIVLGVSLYLTKRGPYIAVFLHLIYLPSVAFLLRLVFEKVLRGGNLFKKLRQFYNHYKKIARDKQNTFVKDEYKSAVPPCFGARAQNF
jgi:hypothetical protein